MNRTHPWYAGEWQNIQRTLQWNSLDSLQPPDLAPSSFLPPSLSLSLLFLPLVFQRSSLRLFLLKKESRLWIWVKYSEAQARRATALFQGRWFLIHLFVVVYACLPWSRDAVSMATPVWVIICVTTFIPLRKGEGREEGEWVWACRKREQKEKAGRRGAVERGTGKEK